MGCPISEDVVTNMATTPVAEEVTVATVVEAVEAVVSTDEANV